MYRNIKTCGIAFGGILVCRREGRTEVEDGGRYLELRGTK